LAKELFDALLGIEEKTDWAAELLHETVKKTSYCLGDKYFRQLCHHNSKFLKKYNLSKIKLKTIRDTMRSLFNDNEDLFSDLLDTFFDQEDIIEMGWNWWITNISTDQFWAGQAEITLFSHIFNTPLVVLKYKERLLDKRTQ
jgi:hypothetical protein